MMLKDKKVLLAITGSIAAYKSAELVRLFKKLGALVRVIQTNSAKDFITPLTLSTLSQNPVFNDMVDSEKNEWNNHVELGLWADLMIIAPLTANTLAKMVHGECDNLLLATYLSAKCPVYFAPAMDLDMYKHPSTKANIKKLEGYGNILIPSGFGELASGLVGEGRMAEPKEIIDHISNHLTQSLPLKGKTILVTAGPTYEAIDPVRFIGNRSSGKMGVSIAIEFIKKGAQVDLVLGPSHIDCNYDNLNVYRVESANEMFDTVNNLFPKSNIAVFAAAVADYTPKDIKKHKIKKKTDSFSLELKKTKDILSLMSNKKKKSQFIVGFALETEKEIYNASIKLDEKKLDMIVLNSLNNKGVGFGLNTNKITIIEKDNIVTDFELKDKKEVAKDIIQLILKRYDP